MRTFLVGFVALIIGLLGGAAPMYLDLRTERAQAEATEARLQADLAQAQRALAITTIHSRLATLISQVQRGEFSEAQASSTDLFNRVEGALASLEEGDDHRRLLTLKETRDEVTAKLAVGDTTVTQTLDRLFTLIGASL